MARKSIYRNGTWKGLCSNPL